MWEAISKEMSIFVSISPFWFACIAISTSILVYVAFFVLFAKAWQKENPVLPSSFAFVVAICLGAGWQVVWAIIGVVVGIFLGGWVLHWTIGRLILSKLPKDESNNVE